MKVTWTNHALEQLVQVYDYISKDSKYFAKKTVDDLTQYSKKLNQYPQLGRIVHEVNNKNIRELLHGHFRIIYKIKKDRIDILALIHTAQQFPTHYFIENE